jgi:hypothetical protein
MNSKNLKIQVERVEELIDYNLRNFAVTHKASLYSLVLIMRFTLVSVSINRDIS